jgi:hypothetical protein
MEFKEIIYETVPDWNYIEFHGKWTSMSVSPKDKDGDIEIELNESGNETMRVYLNKENIQHLITYLEKQLL